MTSTTNLINAGIDMAMLAITNPNITPEVYQMMVRTAVTDGGISIDRINEAVTRILGVKCIMGLIDGVDGCATRNPEHGYDQEEARQNALYAAKQSLVLLKNDNSTLPVDISKLKYIVLTGERDID